MDSRQLARVSTLLDEACEEMGTAPSVITMDVIQRDSRAIAKVREAQSILLGERPTHPEEN